MRSIRQYTFQIILSVFVVLVLSQCNCTDCPNSIEDRLASFTYENNDIVQFIEESTKNIISDTVKINYLPPGSYRCSGEKEGKSVCHGSFTMLLGNFSIKMSQGFTNTGPRSPNNGFKISYGFNCVLFYNKEKVNLNYMGRPILVSHYEIDTAETNAYYDFSVSPCSQSNYCTDFYIDDNDKLIQYNLLKNDKIEKWILKE